MAVGFNYKQGQYKGKVTRLDTCRRQLETLLEDFTTKKNELQNYWDDPEALSYLRTLNSNINACNKALFNTKTTIATINGMIDEMEGAEQDVDDYIDFVKKAAEVINTLMPSE